MSDGIDLFSGARGWEARAHRSLGLDLLGIEWWEPANRTSKAANLRTLQADIAALDPADHAGELAATGARLLLGSPPCPTYSAAGNGAGKHDLPHVVACTRELAEGRDTRAEHLERCKDGRSMLVVEPLRWALALRPRAVVLEQVPAVLPYWRQVGEILGALGYSWWAGVLEAERFGVPQTRERAILIARNDGQAAHPPEPTHHRFVPNEPRPQDEHGLFGEIKSWVSMAEALGWDDGPSPSPSPTVSAGGTASGGGVEVFASRESRARVAGAVAMRSGQTIAGGEHARREGDEPAVTITGRADLNQWQMRANAQGSPPTARPGGPSGARTRRANASVRDADEPAPTIKGGHDTADRVWTTERPATTVNGDPRISQPGWHDPAVSGSQQAGAIRVTVEEAAALQSFPPDWPWAGDGEKPNTRTAQFTMVGNAVPPLLGECVLRTVLPAERWAGSPPT